MHIATLNDLLAADDLQHWEAPPGFDYQTEKLRVADLREPLNQLTGLTFEQDSQIQDASYFTEIRANDPVIRHRPGIGQTIESFAVVRFSAFGRLFMIWDCSTVSPLSDEMRLRIAGLVCTHGYIYAPTELLEQPYPDPKRFRDWGYRFFDYL